MLGLNIHTVRAKYADQLKDHPHENVAAIESPRAVEDRDRRWVFTDLRVNHGLHSLGMTSSEPVRLDGLSTLSVSSVRARTCL